MRTPAMRTAVLVVAALAVGACGGRHEPLRVTVSPASAPLDVPFTIAVSGAEPGAVVNVRAAGRAGSGATWSTSLGGFADDSGRLRLRDRYLLARLQPDGGGSELDAWPRRITVTVTTGHARAVASARRAPPPPHAFRTTDLRVARSGFYGTWYAPSGATRHTALLVFGGSDGGLPSYVRRIAETLAGDGYPVLAVAYFAAPGLPRTLDRISLEYFEQALRWLGHRPAVDPHRVATLGYSRGGELALLLGATFPRLVHGVIAYVPSSAALPGYPDTHEPAWTYRGRGVRGPIPVERISGPVLAVGGEADRLWPSADYVRQIAARLRAHGRSVTALTYAGAGHLVATAVPNQVEFRSTIAANPKVPDFGGSAAADERAREDAWPRVLRLLASL